MLPAPETRDFVELILLLCSETLESLNYAVRQNVLLYYTQQSVCRKVSYPLLESPYSVSIHCILMICYSRAD
jgi:hypothetical protein